MTVATESFYDRSMELGNELLRGAIDSHVHAGPVLKSNPSYPDPFQVAEEARDAGMRAIVYYDVFGTSSGTAFLVGRRVEGIEVFGGIILSSCQGGMNPRAVLTALYYGSGARFVSFGAHCTYFQASQEARLIDGELVPIKDVYPKFAERELSIATRIPLEDPIPSELDEILAMVAEHPEVYLNTGHVSPEEALRVIDLAERYGIKKVLVAHPVRRFMTVEQQKEAARRGAFLESATADWFYPGVPRTHYYVEREYIDQRNMVPREVPGAYTYFSQIREVGPEHFVICTDYGVRAAPSAVQGMRSTITTLLDMEFTPDEIRTMTATNPARLIGLD
jgi:hypothetical protein